MKFIDEAQFSISPRDLQSKEQAINFVLNTEKSFFLCRDIYPCKLCHTIFAVWRCAQAVRVRTVVNEYGCCLYRYLRVPFTMLFHDTSIFWQKSEEKQILVRGGVSFSVGSWIMIVFDVYMTANVGQYKIWCFFLWVFS